MGIMEAHVNPLHRAREDGAGFLGVVADADHQINLLVHHVLYRLGVQAFGRQAGKLQCLNGAIGHLGLGLSAGRNSSHQAGQVVVEDSFSHLGAAGVSSAKHQNGFLSSHDQITSSIGWRVGLLALFT